MEKNIETIIWQGVSVLLIVAALTLFFLNNNLISDFVDQKFSDHKIFRENANKRYENIVSGAEVIRSIINDDKGITFIIIDSVGNVVGTFVNFNNLSGLSMIGINDNFQITYTIAGKMITSITYKKV